VTTDSADASVDRTWVIAEAEVRSAIRRLIGRRAHPFFLGYVHLRQQATKIGSTDNIAADWPALGRVLEVPGAPAKRPYLKPFQTAANREDEYQWWNANIAGSWSPASLRPGMGPLEVVSVNADKTYNLRPGHATLALDHLLYGRPMSVIDFATFLFRDYGLLASTEPRIDDLVANYRLEYGVMDDAEFATLYDSAPPALGPRFFEELQVGVES
jgi:hypothetical protein